MIGETLKDRYLIEEKIGEGGMAIIYKAQDLRLKRFVAVKVLRSHLANEEEILSRFLREAQSAARLVHPNIVSVYDIEEEPDRKYIVMEYVESHNLKELIQEGAPFDLDTVIQLFRQIASAVKYAHENGIIHRDLKPQNVLITDEGFLKVTDFGIARAITSSSLTQTGTMMGSVQYFSPEQAQGKPVDKTADIYSLGIMLFECLTGKLPFHGENPIAIALKQVQETPPLPSGINPSVGAELDEVVTRCLSKSADNRFQDVDEFIRGLKIAIGKKDVPDSIASSGSMEELEPTLIMKSGPLSSESKKEEIKEDSPRSTRKKPEKLSIYTIILVLFILFLTYVFIQKGILVAFFNEDTVPDLEGYNLARAREIADARGLEIRIEEERFDNNVPEGRIISQTPVVGEQIKRGGTIKVVVSRGKHVVEVPNLVGMDVNNAMEELTSLGLKGVIGKRVDSNKYSKDVIISHDPLSQEMVYPGRKIIFEVSNGPQKIEVPDLLGKTPEEVRKELVEKGLKLSIAGQEYSETYLKGTIISQEREPGSTVDKGAEIKVKVSQGAQAIKAPDLTGKPIVDARSFLEPMGIKIIIEEGKDTYIINRQEPGAGAPIGSDKSIRVWSKIPSTTVIVPNLLGRTLEDAQNVIDKNGLSMGKIYYKSIPGTVDGAVLDQQPGVGKEVNKGTPVDLTLSQTTPGTTTEPPGDESNDGSVIIID
ncbi:MAG: Stk1 family PASTA domain-containing Ser/Thr kinase [Vulcanimicrobiota bacterium]